MLSIYRLPNHLPGEKVIKIVRRDIFILMKRLLFNVGLMILPVVLLAVLTPIFPDEIMGEIGLPLVMLGVSAYYLFIWLFSFFSFIDYYLDVWLVTNERIIDVEQKGFFDRIISEQRLYRIQDVTSEMRGFIPTVLSYGNVFIQTAGTKERFNFYDVPHPDRVRDTIIKLAEISKAKYKNEVQTGQEESGQRLQEALDKKL